MQSHRSLSVQIPLITKSVIAARFQRFSNTALREKTLKPRAKYSWQRNDIFERMNDTDYAVFDITQSLKNQPIPTTAGLSIFFLCLSIPRIFTMRFLRSRWKKTAKKRTVSTTVVSVTIKAFTAHAPKFGVPNV